MSEGAEFFQGLNHFALLADQRGVLGRRPDPVKDAKAAYTRAKGGEEVSHAKATGTAKDVSEARRDAVKDTNDANYKAAKERCDAMSGDAKTTCQNDVAAKFKK